MERTGYYAWLKRREVRQRQDTRINGLIRKEFDRSRGIYGPDRIVQVLRQSGEKIGRRRCVKRMSDMGLSSSHNRRRSRSLTDSRRARGDGYANVLRNEQFPIIPRMGMTSDITYLRTGEGFMYLCVVRDIVTGEVLGEHMSDRMTKELVIKAILAAQARNRILDGCVFHSDRGSQYTSGAVMELLGLNGIRQSFSRVGMPGDNSWSESFFAMLKKELIHWKNYGMKESVRAAVFEYIHCFHNGERIQKRLGYLSPREYFNLIQSGEHVGGIGRKGGMSEGWARTKSATTEAAGMSVADFAKTTVLPVIPTGEVGSSNRRTVVAWQIAYKIVDLPKSAFKTQKLT